MIPDAVLVVAFGWSALLLVAGGLLLLRARDSLHRLLALDVLGTIVIIMLATLSDLNGGDFARAVQHASDVLAICGKIYPSTAANVALEAILADGTRVEGETRISKSKARIRRIRIKPARPRPMALQW